MRLTALAVFACALWIASPCMAQQWELGVVAGYGAAKQVAATRAGQQADAGFKPGLTVGVLGGHNLYDYVSGEFRYVFRRADLKVSSGGTEVGFRGRAHVVHYDLLLFSRKRDEPLRPYAAAGAGIKVYEGRGREAAFQPLNRFAILTRTLQVKPLVSVGGGIKVKIASGGFLRFELRDYLTPFPENVIAPAPGAKVGGWIHDFVPMVSLTFGF